MNRAGASLVRLAGPMSLQQLDLQVVERFDLGCA
jgi:hypothetical protein